MFVVFTDRQIHYLGVDQKTAQIVWGDCLNATLTTVGNLEDLALVLRMPMDNLSDESEDVEPFDDYEERVNQENLSEAAAKIFDKLDSLGLNAENTDNWARTLKEKSQQAVAEVRSLGIKSMKAMGEGFVALGDLLKNEAAEEAFIKDLQDTLSDDDDEMFQTPLN